MLISLNFFFLERRFREHWTTFCKTYTPSSEISQLSLNDFKDGKEKIKLTTGEKIYSRSFTLKNITLPGGTILEKVRCKMVDDGKPTILGYNAFRNYQETEIKEDEMKLYLKKIVE